MIDSESLSTTNKHIITRTSQVLWCLNVANTLSKFNYYPPKVSKEEFVSSLLVTFSRILINFRCGSGFFKGDQLFCSFWPHPVVWYHCTVMANRDYDVRIERNAAVVLWICLQVSEKKVNLHRCFYNVYVFVFKYTAFEYTCKQMNIGNKMNTKTPP